MADLTPEEFRRLGHRLVDWVADYRAGLDDLPVTASPTPGQVRAALPAELPEEPAADLGDALVGLLDDVVVPATLHWQHPGFFGYFPANASLASLLGDIASGGIGAQGMLWSTSPAGTELEQVVLDGLATALGLGDDFTFAGGGGGSLQDSASSGALVALLAALHRRTPDWRRPGSAAASGSTSRPTPTPRWPRRSGSPASASGPCARCPSRPARRPSTPTRWPPRWPRTSPPGWCR